MRKVNTRIWRLVAGLLLLCLAMGACGDQTPPVITVVITSAPADTPGPADRSGFSETSPQADAPSPTAPSASAGIEILEATFAHGLTEEMLPVEPGSAFDPEDTIHLSLKLRGRPKEGIVTARFYYGDMLIAEASVDLGASNSGLVFSFGEDTYLGYTLSHEQPFPASEEYRAEVFYGDVALASYPFQVIAPPGSLVSRITDVLLALGSDENLDPVHPTTIFSSAEEVHLVGEGDMAAGSTIRAEWYVDGQLDDAGTRVLSPEQDIPQGGFVFSFLPDGGWPPGEHEVVLTLNGEESGRFPFLVIDSGEAAPLAEPGFWDVFPIPDDAEVEQVVEGFDLGFATSMDESRLFEYYRAWLHGQGWQLVSSQGASGFIQDWTKEGARLHLELQSIDDQGRAVIWAQFEPSP